MRSFTIIAAALAGLAAASPVSDGHHKGYQDLNIVHIAYTTPNGTYSRPFEIAPNSGVQKHQSPGPVSHLFISPPFDGRRYVVTECTFQTPTNKSLGVISVRKPKTLPVRPAALIAYIECTTANSTSKAT